MPDPTRAPNPCQCGCGQDAGYFPYNNKASGIVKGTPRRFILGHHSRLPEYQQKSPPFEECYTVQSNGCWFWNVIRDGDDGYGKYWIRGRKYSAHRVSYERRNGPIPKGARVDHVCHDPKACPGGVTCPHRSCVNPDHLQLLTHADNCRRGALAKLSMEQAADIRRRRSAGEKGVDLAREYGVRPSTISWITTGKTWAGTP